MSAPELVSEANRWLRFATEDLKVAQNLLASNESAPRHICFLAQQAAEKALKAALVLEEMDFRFGTIWIRNLLPHDIQVIDGSGL